MRNDLPSPNTRRWVKSRKFLVVTAIRSGLITEQEAETRYRLSSEELRSWSVMLDTFGVQGLRATRVQDYRNELQDTRMEAA